VQRYKKFLGEVHGQFGSLNPSILVAAIRDAGARRFLRSAYRHIERNHNDVSLVLWHGPKRAQARVRLTTTPYSLAQGFRTRATTGNGGSLLTGDITCTDPVVDRLQGHFRRLLGDTSCFLVPHHGSAHSWNRRLLTTVSHAALFVVSAGLHNAYYHPDPEVVESLENTRGGFRWFLSHESNRVAIHIQAD
jgi:hypothetical protein